MQQVEDSNPAYESSTNNMGSQVRQTCSSHCNLEKKKREMVTLNVLIQVKDRNPQNPQNSNDQLDDYDYMG